MRFSSSPTPSTISAGAASQPIALFSAASGGNVLTAGWSASELVRRRGLQPDRAAWDLLAIALSVIVADGATERKSSPDGWTRQIVLEVALGEPERWSPHAEKIESALKFLTTDLWEISFTKGGQSPPSVSRPHSSSAEGVALLSGGLDSLIGTIDLTTTGSRLLAVSQTVRGDADKQTRFASRIGGGLEHLQLNHNATKPWRQKETSQRARSMIFLAFAVMAASSTQRYKDGEPVPLYICENGFIAVNPPLTSARTGSLSTRTAHPEFLCRMQSILDAVGINVRIDNPYAERTKGEMLRQCLDQDLVKTEAALSTSCGRFQRFNYKHCGRCVPCQIRRAAFLAWGISDSTAYHYDNLSLRDEEHAAFDDVRSVSLAIITSREEGFSRWLGPTLASPLLQNRSALRGMLQRGLDELSTLHEGYGLI